MNIGQAPVAKASVPLVVVERRCGRVLWARLLAEWHPGSSLPSKNQEKLYYTIIKWTILSARSRQDNQDG
jgi:hypothetical protein